MFCKNCGTKNDPTKKFCKKCGAPINHDVKQEAHDEDQTDSVTKQQNNQTDTNVKEEKIPLEQSTTQKVHSTPKEIKSGLEINYQDREKQKPVQVKKMKRSTKVGIALVAIIALLVLGAYKFGENYYAYENQRDRAIDVLKTLDAKEYSNILTSNHPSFEVTEESIVPLVDYLTNNQEAYNDTIRSLMGDENSFSSYDMLYFERTGKHFGIFDQYDLVVTPVQFYLQSNIENVLYTYQNEEVTATEDHTSSYVGLVAPGEHHVSAQAEFAGEETVIEHTEDILYLDENGYIPEVFIEFETFDLTVVADVEDGTVYLNDIELGELSDSRGEFGPLVWREDQTITLKTTLSSGETHEESIEMRNDLTRYEFDVYPSISRYDISDALNHVYDQAAALAEEESEGLLDGLARLLVNGEENDLFKTYKNAGKRYRDNDDVNSVLYSIVINDYEMIDLTTIHVQYDVRVTEYGEAYNTFDLSFDGVMQLAEDDTFLLESAKVVE